jgi:hypothetical protein
MREGNFRKPRVRDIFEFNGINVSEKINSEYVLSLINEGILVLVGSSYREAVETLEGLAPGKVALFPEKFDISRSEAEHGIKSLEHLVKIDSSKVLREVSGRNDAPNRMTKEFLQQNRVLPYDLAKISLNSAELENPPIGFYWVGSDNHVRVVTWLRSVAGAEMKVMKDADDFEGCVLDSKTYGRNIRVSVRSRTEEGKAHEFSLSKLPIFRKNDLRQFSEWIDLEHSSSDSDSNYRGLEHDKRVHGVYVWSAPAVFGFYEAMSFVKELRGPNQFRINPFPIPKDKKMMDFIDDLRLRSLILRKVQGGKIELQTLNKNHIERVIGARTNLRGYEDCWTHFGKKDFSFLYQPE